MMSRRASNVVEPRFFRFILGLEIQKASRLRYSVGVIILSPDVPTGEPDRALSSLIARVSLAPLRATDIATILPNSSVALMLVDAETPTLPAIFERATRAINEATVTTLAGIHRPSLSAGASCYPLTASTEDELMEQAELLMARARVKGGRQLCLPD